jgi:hypothetical protein
VIGNVSKYCEIKSFSKGWTDDLKRDTTFFGVGNVNNQIHLANGTKLEAHPYEDRSFAYELIENQIFAYGILDGYNGTFFLFAKLGLLQRLIFQATLLEDVFEF